MVVCPILAVGFFMRVVAAVFVICAILLILLILIQKGRGVGLSGAFGGGMASGILGTKTGDFLTWATIGMVSLFLTLSVVMAKYYKPTVSDYNEGQPQTSSAPVQQPQEQQPQQQSMPSTAGDDIDFSGDANFLDE